MKVYERCCYKVNINTVCVQSTSILHVPVAEILQDSERCHFYSRLENKDGCEEKVEYFQSEL